ncbi:MAG: DinB family protein [Planctomycetota bacterium]
MTTTPAADPWIPAYIGQMEAVLSMMRQLLARCPDHLWAEPIGIYPFWNVAYHALCFVDVYLSPSDEAWEPIQSHRGNQTFGPGGLHPLGRTELDEEFPSRRFEPAELMHYADICQEKLHSTMAAETAETLAGDCGFAFLKMTRRELHFYNFRHITHHLGQLSAFLHRHNIQVRWKFTGY